MDGKHQNQMTHRGGRRRIRRPDPGASGGGWLEILLARSPRRSPPPWPARVARGVARNSSHGQNPFALKTVQNDLVRGPQVLGNFSRALELKMSVLGIGFYLARKAMFI